MSLKGKICVITAAGQGIGRATAELFFNEGATVYARLGENSLKGQTIRVRLNLVISMLRH